MNKVLKNTLVTLGGALLGVTAFYFYAGAQVTDTDSITLTVTVEDGVDIEITETAHAFTLDPVNEPESGTNDVGDDLSVTVSVASADGYNVDALMEDLDGTDNQLCNEDSVDTGTCEDSPAYTLAGESSGVSYIGSTSDNADGTNVAAGDLVGTLVKYGAVPNKVATSAGPDAFSAGTFTINLHGGVDFEVAPAVYKGTVTYTITDAA